MMFLCDMIMIRYQNQCSAPIVVESLLIVGNWIVKGPTVPFQSRLFLHLKFMVNNKKNAFENPIFFTIMSQFCEGGRGSKS